MTSTLRCLGRIGSGQLMIVDDSESTETSDELFQLCRTFPAVRLSFKQYSALVFSQWSCWSLLQGTSFSTTMNGITQ